jgi:hypothetical protein
MQLTNSLALAGVILASLAGDVAWALIGGGVTVGAACKVTGGPHTGKTGTYDSDGWCCFRTTTSDVCVECAGDRCSSTAGTVRRPSIQINPGTTLSQ